MECGGSRGGPARRHPPAPPPRRAGPGRGNAARSRSTPGPRARTSTGPSPRARGEPADRPPGPRLAGTLLGALLPRTRVPLSSVAMSSVFGKPRAGSGPQSAPLEVNLAILGRRGAGKSGESGGEQKGRGWAGTGESGSGCGRACRQVHPLVLGASCTQVGWVRQRDFLLCLSFSVAWLSLYFVLCSSISHLSSVPRLSFLLCL